MAFVKLLVCACAVALVQVHADKLDSAGYRYEAPVNPLVYEPPAPVYEAPSPTYGTPAPSYRAPSPTYGTPAPSYRAPSPTYRTPAPAPAPAPAYKAPTPTYKAPTPSYKAPSPTRRPPTPTYTYEEPSSEEEEYHQPGMPFDFAWTVNDGHSGNDFAHASNSDGNVVKGEYRVDLPDGRTQIVTYTANGYDGYVAQVKYEGEAHFPEYEPAPAPTYHAPAPSYRAPEPTYGTPSH